MGLRFHRRGKKNLNFTDDPEQLKEQALPYLEYRSNLKELDFHNQNNVALARYCFDHNPALVSSLNPDSANDVIALKSWIKTNISHYFLCRKHGVDNLELLTLYLTKKMTMTHDATKNQDLILLTSYDRKFLLDYQYKTMHGETIAYFDETLGIPVSLVAHANVKLKLTNAQKLVEKIDVDLISLDLDLVKNYLTGILNRVIRDTVLTFISSKKPSYYELPQYYTLLNKGIVSALSVNFAECGWSLVEFNLSDLTVPNDTDKLLKSQLFAISEAERLKNYEQKMERQSLDLYERKAAIHEKYPNFPVGMTETEKDLALNRYLNRIGKETKLRAELNEQLPKEREVRHQGTRYPVPKSRAFNYFRPRNLWRIFYAVLVAVAFLVAGGLFLVSTKVGLIALGVAAGVALVAGLCLFPLLYKDRPLKPVIVPEHDSAAVPGQPDAPAPDEEPAFTSVPPAPVVPAAAQSVDKVDTKPGKSGK